MLFCRPQICEKFHVSGHEIRVLELILGDNKVALLKLSVWPKATNNGIRNHWGWAIKKQHGLNLDS